MRLPVPFRRGPALPRCPGCGKPLVGPLDVMEMDPADGRIKRYHQRCAPSALRNRTEAK